jgi:hypothetical protein
MSVLRHPRTFPSRAIHLLIACFLPNCPKNTRAETHSRAGSHRRRIAALLFFPPNVLLPNTTVARHQYPPGRSTQSTTSPQQPNHIHSNHIYTNIHFGVCTPFFGPLRGIIPTPTHSPQSPTHPTIFFPNFSHSITLFGYTPPFLGPYGAKHITSTLPTVPYTSLLFSQHFDLLS